MPDTMGTRIVVTEDLSTSSASIMGIANAIGDQLSQLRNLLVPLREYWTGGATDRWEDMQAKWDGAANNLMAAPGQLGAIAEAAGINWNNYVDCEMKNVASWSH